MNGLVAFGADSGCSVGCIVVCMGVFESQKSAQPVGRQEDLA